MCSGSQVGKSLDNDVVRSYESAVATARRPVYVISIAASLAGCHPRTLRIQFHDIADLLEELADATDENGDGTGDDKATPF